MSDTYQKFLIQGSRAGMRYALSVPHRAALGVAGVKVGNRGGSSLEFKDHREYQSGDDLRHIDWGAFARSDKLIVKLFREEISPHVDILLDGSRSMALEGSPKAEASLGLAALLAEAAANGGYTHSAWIAREGCRKIANGNDRPHLWDGITFDSTQTLTESLLRFQPAWRRQGIRILISDLLWMGNPLSTLQLIENGAAVTIVVQVLAQTDVNPSELGNICLVDSETEEIRELFVDESVLKRYRDRLVSHQENWNRACKQIGARMTTVVAEKVVRDWHLEELIREEILQFAG